MKLIKENASKIKKIAGERMFIELEKIQNKGNMRLGAQLLKDTGLFREMFDFDIKQSMIDRSPFEDVNTMSEFVFLLLRLTNNPAEIFKNKLKGDIPTSKEIEALEYGFTNDFKDRIKNRMVVHNMFVKSPNALNGNILSSELKSAASDLKSGKYPKTTKELNVDGNDLMKIGLKGKEVGDELKSMLVKVYFDKVKNNREDLLSMVSNNKT
jgi:tRNA nucleotidyltransferase (CCA-adding enzyme)